MTGHHIRDRLADFPQLVDEQRTPNGVLDLLHGITSEHRLLNVLGAGRFPIRFGDWSSVVLGETVFLHDTVPVGWWESYSQLAQTGYDPGLMMARISLAPYTWTENRRQLDPIGADRWPFELAMSHGMRDGLTCPVGSRWVVAFWAPKVLSAAFPQQIRALLFMAASFAAMRLEKIVGPDPRRLAGRAILTPRELAVLRLASMGKQTSEIAVDLHLSAETTRTHLKKAQVKLGAYNRTHAVSEALRQRLIA